MFTPVDLFDLSLKRRSSGMDVMVLAPWVIAMRMPALAYEVATPWLAKDGKRGGEGELALTEKTDALMESYNAAQAEMISAWSALVIGAMRGEVPNAQGISKSLQDISDASIEPMAKRVRANYKRLRKG
ncbi:hypothetical protein [Ahrensia kielensis]|uniref:hypothetical protein n=1 Tax=Ahrensia kielensis TaxID=76980 RepID=UPI0003616081|nr:hypothetical protein [Ahrensia kielensis]